MVNNTENKTTPTTILIHITSTIKNTLVTLVDPSQTKPKVLLQITSRGYPIKMKKKNNAYILQKMSMQIVEQVKNIKNVQALIIIKGTGQGRHNLIKYLTKNLKIVAIFDKTPIPFNGCRPKKQKRR